MLVFPTKIAADDTSHPGVVCLLDSVDYCQRHGKGLLLLFLVAHPYHTYQHHG